MSDDQKFQHNTIIATHSFYESHLDALYLDLQKLKMQPAPPAACLIPEYCELTCQQLFIQTSAPKYVTKSATGAEIASPARPLARFDRAALAKNLKQVFMVYFALLDSGVFVHQQGCVIRQFSVENVLVCKAGYKVLCYYQETNQATLVAHCPPQFCTTEFYNYNVYTDPIIQKGELYLYRKYLAFPATLRLRQKIKFSINCDIYSLGAFMYETVTGAPPPSPFEIESNEQLEQARVSAMKQLQKFSFGDMFNNVLLKTLFMIEGNYYYSFLEIQSDVQQIYKMAQKMQLQPVTIMNYQSYNQIIQSKMQTNQGSFKQIIEHVAASIQYIKMTELRKQVPAYEAPSQVAPVQVASTQFRQLLEVFANQYSSHDLDKIFSADASGTGKIVLLQGCFGSGKTQFLMDVQNYCNCQFFAFSCYVPTKKFDIFYSKPDFKQLLIVPESFIKNDKMIAIPILNFAHYVCIHLMYAIQAYNIQKLNEKLLVNLSEFINNGIIKSICPGFSKYLNINPLQKSTNVTVEIVRDVLFKVIDSICQCSLMLTLFIDDLQSNMHQDEIRLLISLIEKQSRLCIVVTEVPGIQVSTQSFSSVSSPQVSYNIQQVFDILKYYVDENEVTDEKTVEKRKTQQKYSEIMSVGSIASQDSNYSKNDTKAVESVKTKSFLFNLCTMKKLPILFVTIDYLDSQQIQTFLKLHQISSTDLQHSFTRKCFGSVKLIKMLLQQLFQHSAWLQQSNALYQSAEQIQVNEINIIEQFLRNKTLQNVSVKQFEILQVSAVLGNFVDQQWIQNVFSCGQEQIQSLCGQICTSHGYMYSFTLENTSIKHKFYSNMQNSMGIENIYQWQSNLIKKLLFEGFTSQFSQTLFDLSKYQLKRYQEQFSFLLPISQRFQFYIPEYDADNLENYIENTIDDIQSVFGIKIKNDVKAIASSQSSIIQFMKRKSPSKLLSKMQQFRMCQKDATNYYENVDGYFIPIETLALCLNQCSDYLPDIFDQIELMQINQTLLKNNTYYGLVPKVLFSYLDQATKQQIEVKKQLKSMGIEKNISMIDQKLNFASKPKAEIQESVHLQYIYFTDVIYDTMKMLEWDFFEFQIQQLRYTNFKNIKDLLVQQSPQRYLECIIKVSQQLIFEQLWEEAIQLLQQTIQQVNANDFVCDTNLTEKYSESIFQSLSNIKAFKLLQSDECEACIQKLLMTFLQVCFFLNKQQIQKSIALAIVRRAFEFGFSEDAICCVYLILKDRYQTVNCDGNLVKILQLLGDLELNSHASAFSTCVKHQINMNCSSVDSLARCKFEHKMTAYLAPGQRQRFSLYIIQTIMFYLQSLYKQKRFAQIAALVYQLYKDIPYINLPQVTQLLLSYGLCAMRSIQKSDDPPRLEHCDTAYDLYQVFVQAHTEYQFGNNQKSLKLVYMCDPDDQKSPELQCALEKVRAKCGVIETGELINLQGEEVKRVRGIVGAVCGVK